MHLLLLFSFSPFILLLLVLFVLVFLQLDLLLFKVCMLLLFCSQCFAHFVLILLPLHLKEHHLLGYLFLAILLQLLEHLEALSSLGHILALLFLSIHLIQCFGHGPSALFYIVVLPTNPHLHMIVRVRYFSVVRLVTLGQPSRKICSLLRV